MEVTPVTNFAEIEKMAASGNLFVINNTDHQGKQSRGIFHMDVTGDDNQPFSVRIPPTWYPINLAQFCEPKLFMKSQTFRKMVGNGTIIVIRDELAHNIMKGAEAVKEKRSVDEFISGSSRAINEMNSQFLDGQTVKISTTKAYSESQAVRDEQKNNDAAVTVASVDDNELHRLITQFNSRELSDDEATERLSGLSPSENAMKEVADRIVEKGSKFFEQLTEMLSNSFEQSNDRPYTGPTPPPGFQF